MIPDPAQRPSDAGTAGGRRTAVGSGDVGQAAERTHLSWRRTVLSALVVMLLAVTKIVVAAPTPYAVRLLGLMLLSWLGLIWLARRRMTALRRMATLRAGSWVPISRSPALIALLIATYAALATLLVR